MREMLRGARSHVSKLCSQLGRGGGARGGGRSARHLLGLRAAASTRRWKPVWAVRAAGAAAAKNPLSQEKSFLGF